MSCELCSCEVMKIPDEKDYNIWATIAGDVFPSLKSLTAVPIICLPCKQMLLKGRRFKDILLETEENIKNYCKRTKKSTPVKLVNVLRSLGREGSMKNDFGICRICLEVNREEATTLSVNSNQVLSIISFIPELNLQATTSPVICTECREEVRLINNFQMKCMESLEQSRRSVSNRNIPQLAETDVNLDATTATCAPDSDNEELSPSELDIEGDSGEEATIYVSDSDGAVDNTEIKMEIEEFDEDDYASLDSKTHVFSMCGIFESSPLKLERSESTDEPKLEDPGKLFEAKNVFTCKICEYMTSSRKDILEHIKVHQKNAHGKPENEERNEPKGTERAARKTRHSNGKNDKEAVFECVTCSRSYPTKESLIRHMKEIHENLSNERKAVVPNKPKLRKRKNKSFYGNSPYLCNYCCESFLTLSTFRYHCETIHNVNISKYSVLKFGDQRRYKCNSCGFTAVNLKSMGEHQYSTHSDDWFLRRWNWRESKAASEQAKKKESKREYTCHKCTYKCTDESSFDKHLAVHIKTTPDRRNSSSGAGAGGSKNKQVAINENSTSTTKRRFFRSKTINSTVTCYCNSCKFKCIGRSIMIKHLRKVHDEDIMKAKSSTSSDNKNINQATKKKPVATANDKTMKKPYFKSKKIDSALHCYCTSCKFKCIGRSIMIEHLRKIHNKDIMRARPVNECSFCERTFKNSDVLATHKKKCCKA